MYEKNNYIKERLNVILERLLFWIQYCFDTPPVVRSFKSWAAFFLIQTDLKTF